MSTLLDRLEKRFGGYAVPNLTLFLLCGQITVWLLAHLELLRLSQLVLAPQMILEAGQWWRVVTFLFVPQIAAFNLWAVIAFYVFYLWGTALERMWGSFRYNCFILCGTVLTVLFVLIVALLLPPQEMPFVGNGFFFASLFLVFTILNSNFEILLFFVLPLRVKWLGWFTVVYWALALVGGSPYVKAAVVASALNIGLFFGREWLAGRKARHRAEGYRAQVRERLAEPFHRCSVCNVTDSDEPDLRFAYKDGKGYCERHWDEMDK